MALGDGSIIRGIGDAASNIIDAGDDLIESLSGEGKAKAEAEARQAEAEAAAIVAEAEADAAKETAAAAAAAAAAAEKEAAAGRKGSNGGNKIALVGAGVAVAALFYAMGRR